MEPALASAYAYFQQNSPENYRFLDFYRHRQNQIDFTYDFRSEAFALRKCLEFMVEHEVDNVKQGRHRLAGSMEGREGEIYFHDYGGCLRAVHFKGVIPSWSASLAGSASLTEVGPPRVPRRGNMLTQLWRVPTCHLTLWRSLDPVVVCLNHRVKCLDVDEFWNSIEIRYAKRKKAGKQNSSITGDLDEWEGDSNTPKVKVTYSGKRSIAASKEDELDISSPNAPLDKPGFNYFAETPSSEWDTLAYHESWRIHGFPLVKSTLIRGFNQQVDWFLKHGLPAEKKKAEFLKNQFKASIDALEGGRISDFWKGVMHSAKLDDIEKNTALEIRMFQHSIHGKKKFEQTVSFLTYPKYRRNIISLLPTACLIEAERWDGMLDLLDLHLEVAVQNAGPCVQSLAC
ncbi:hypothetical protein BC936DRAFT_139461 [Jimgerdemannia flammicorona]|uniref:Uncharacterized protein n=1 Tax=Jimgerdemannia flammicorona TaxID=994334 RepID=A0A433B9V6_9FUNG|nr:hypothetical protein BC936DRAFT_139461 [Jimgerdemannia flammicorona]